MMLGKGHGVPSRGKTSKSSGLKAADSGLEAAEVVSSTTPQPKNVPSLWT